MPRLALGLAAAALSVACADAGPTAADPSLARGAAAAGVRLVALTADNVLLALDAAQPNRVLSEVAITGLAAGERVVGVDVRPSDLRDDGASRIGLLYAVTDRSRLYVVDPATGAASMPVALAVPVSGTVVGFGFNPAADRLRIHGSDRQNLRVNPDDGATLVDGVLTFAAGDANAGAAPRIAALAYTNSDADPATGTALYAIDSGLDVLARLDANAGILTTVGALGVNVAAAGGFDVAGEAGGTAYAILSASPSGKPTLFTIDLATGAATRVGLLAQTRAAIVSVALVP